MGADLVQRRLALGPGIDQLPLARLQGRPGVDEFLLLGGDRVASRFDPLLGVAEASDDSLDFVAKIAHPADHRLVHPVQAVEVFGPDRQVGDAVGLDDHAE